MSIIEAKVIPEKLVFAKNDFRIYRCSSKHPDIQVNQYNSFSLKGEMQRLDLGVEFIAQIELAEVHPQYGASYNCLSIYREMPTTTEDQREFLKFLITENQINEIFKVYPNENIVELVETDKFDYKIVKGFGETTYLKLKDKIMQYKGHRELLSKLGRYGITYSVIVKLAEKYDSAELAIQKVEENPYILAAEIQGVGFKKADVIAKNMGIAYDSPYRIRAGIEHSIETHQESGHTYMKRDELTKAAIDILEVEEGLIEKEIKNTSGIIEFDDNVALKKTYYTEKNIAQKLKMLASNKTELDFDPEDFIKRMEEEHKSTMKNGLTDQQKQLFYNVKKSAVNLLIGSAGCGKSAMQKLLVELLDELKITYTLLSPTAQAAKVMTGYTGIKASTIHRKIGYGKDKEEKHLNEIHEDFVIVDEASMVDIFIMNMLLSKIKNGTRILFCGDSFQLASVGCGTTLHDMIESGVIPLTKLDIVFRQSEGGILDIATRIRLGQKFMDNSDTGMKRFGSNLIVHCTSDMIGGYKHYYKQLLKMYDPKDIMVLSPKKVGELGTIAINRYIQSMVNESDGIKLEYDYNDEITFKQEDLVINKKNIYDTFDDEFNVIDVVNGDSGRIIDIIIEGEKIPKEIIREDGETEIIMIDPRGVKIEFDNFIVTFPFNILDQLLHKWCITGHSSQGSSAKAVIVVLDKSHKFQASANLLYTMLTRSIENAVILSQAETINYAMRKVDNLRRNTMLEVFLREEFGESGEAA